MVTALAERGLTAPPPPVLLANSLLTIFNGPQLKMALPLQLAEVAFAKNWALFTLSVPKLLTAPPSSVSDLPWLIVTLLSVKVAPEATLKIRMASLPLISTVVPPLIVTFFVMFGSGPLAGSSMIVPATPKVMMPPGLVPL